MKHEKFTITGMSCSACSARVEKAVNKLDGIDKASVHLLNATPTAHLLEHLDVAAPLLAEPLAVKDGMALVPERRAHQRVAADRWRGLRRGRLRPGVARPAEPVHRAARP